MAIAFDNSTQHTRTTSGSSTSFSHTCSGSDRILFVFVNAVNPTGNTASSVTYDGVAMTKIDDEFAQVNVNTSLWYLVAPATGSNTVTVNFATLGSYVDCAASSYTGAAQTSPIDANSKNNTTGNSVSTTVTSTTDNCWVVTCGYHGALTSLSAGGTSREITISGSQRGLIGDSNAAVTPAGGRTMTISGGSSQTSAIIAAAFKPAGAAPAATGFSQAVVIM